MKTIDAVIFDMDGLMLDTERVGWDAFTRIAARYGVTMPFAEYRNIIGTTQKNVNLFFGEKFGENFPIEAFNRDVFHERDVIVEEEGVPLKPGLCRLLSFLQENGKKRMIATSSPRRVMENYLTRADLLCLFDGSVCGDEITHSKPHPEIFLAAAQKAGVFPSHALVLEDSVNGVRAAHNAGMRCVFIKDLLDLPDELRKTCYACPDTLADVIGLFETGRG